MPGKSKENAEDGCYKTCIKDQVREPYINRALTLGFLI